MRFFFSFYILSLQVPNKPSKGFLKQTAHENMIILGVYMLYSYASKFVPS